MVDLLLVQLCSPGNFADSPADLISWLSAVSSSFG